MPSAADRRRRIAHYGAPALFLLAVTIAVLLIRSGLQSGSPGHTTTSPPATAATTTGQATTKAPHAQYYTVQSGDTFGSIAAKTGISVAELERLNPTVSATALQVGQKLRVK